MVCDWETGRVEVGYFGSRSRERERDNRGESLAGAELCVRDECLISVLPMRGAQTKWMFLYFIRTEAPHRLYWGVRAGRWQPFSMGADRFVHLATERTGTPYNH